MSFALCCVALGSLSLSKESVRSLGKAMGKLRQKIPRLKLCLAEYQDLRMQVLRRDGWRCQRCGTSKDLHVLHMKSRSRLGDDAMRNLITLCATCHKSLHRRTYLLHDE
jgi:hypothetical protein